MSEVKNASNYGEIIKLIKKYDVEFVDFRFSDMIGKFHHITYKSHSISENMLKNGIRFDGSSIIGWKCISESDMLMMPDASTAYLDPFTSQSCLVLICDIIEPETGKPYSRDTRSIATKSQEYLRKEGIADEAIFGCEPEFFIFDSMRFSIHPENSFFKISSTESSFSNDSGSGKEYTPGAKGGYMPCPPIDSLHDIRCQITNAMEEVGIIPTLHHHEVSHSQCEVGFMHSDLRTTADNLQKFKNVVRNVASMHDKIATFLPKPLKDDNGSGLHTHQSLWKNGEPLFYKKGQYADLSDMSIYYIGGIIKHAKAINAFCNSSTNSYKRLTPGFEAPVKLVYSAKNRSAAIRIPLSFKSDEKRIEVRFPDSIGNPYLGFASMLMAGIDGIKNKIMPSEPVDKDLYQLNKKEQKEIPSVSASLQESLSELDRDRDFLKQGDVFNDDIIDAYIKIKRDEVEKVDKTPSPIEFYMYYAN